MRVIALDSTTRAGSVALVEDDCVIDERGGDASRTHAERLPAEITALAEAHGLALADVDLYAVASGPGSFTGLRIGIATIQGLAFVHRRRIVGIPALEALAYAAASDEAAGTLIAAWMDAHRRDVFAALYRVGDGRLERVDDASVGDPASILARWRDRSSSPRIVVGDGATAFSAEISRALPGAAIVPAMPIAGAIGRLAVARARDAVDPAAIRPLYVRRPDAVIAREKQ
jgi:tRNA threonylcarbamoyladenosine biosynthesis protein TsaB